MVAVLGQCAVPVRDHSRLLGYVRSLVLLGPFVHLERQKLAEGGGRRWRLCPCYHIRIVRIDLNVSIMKCVVLSLCGWPGVLVELLEGMLLDVKGGKGAEVRGLARKSMLLMLSHSDLDPIQVFEEVRRHPDLVSGTLHFLQSRLQHRPWNCRVL